MGIWDFSPIADANATADASINFQEGQPAATVNNSARTLMQRLRFWADDTGGAIITGGSGNAYTATTSSTIATLRAGLTIKIRANRANTGAVTLNVDGKGAKPWRSMDGSDATAGRVVSNAFYDCTYYAAADEWRTVFSPLAGNLIGVQIFPASGTYTRSAGVTSVVVEAVGGGGGGGGVVSASAGNATVAGGGGGGGFSRRRVAPAATETVTVGVAGTAGSTAGGAGGTGGTSSFGAWLSATGGGGGQGVVTSATTSGNQGAFGGGGGTGSGGDVNVPGESGGGNLFAVSPIFIASGVGGAAASYGVGGASKTSTGAGNSGAGYGGGGSGAVSYNGSAASAGGNGAPGIVIVWEYA